MDENNEDRTTAHSVGACKKKKKKMGVITFKTEPSLTAAVGDGVVITSVQTREVENSRRSLAQWKATQSRRLTGVTTRNRTVAGTHSTSRGQNSEMVPPAVSLQQGSRRSRDNFLTLWCLKYFISFYILIRIFIYDY